MRVLAIDPGPTSSAFVVYDGRILEHDELANDALLARLIERNFGTEYVTVIEQIEGFGLPVGRELFETVWWSGRFAQASRPFERMPRKVVKRHLCGRINTKDRDVRLALATRFGGGFPKGFVSHRFAALAVAVTWIDKQTAEHEGLFHESTV